MSAPSQGDLIAGFDADGVKRALLTDSTGALQVGGVTVNTGALTIAGVTIADGSDISQGAKGDSAVTSSAASGSVIALLKGLLSKLSDPATQSSLASVLAKQPALGTAGTSSADVISVQGIANGTKILTTPDLPSGAATAAKQPSLGTAGTASANVITVQGIASMTKLLVTADAITGTVTTVPTANTRTLTGGASVSTDGTVATGKYSVTFIFSSDFGGSIAGTTFTGGSVDKSFTTPPLPAGQTYGTITYTVSSGSMRILSVA